MPVVPYIPYIIAAGAAIDQHETARKVSNKQDRLHKLEEANRASQAARERRKQIRQQAAQVARIQNMAAINGQAASSAPTNAIANVQSSVNENIGNINAAEQFGMASSNLQQDIFNLQQPSTTSILLKTANNLFEIPKIKLGEE